MSKEKLRIAEIFTSIQGEGMWLGTPSTFIRVSGCNLRCAWCDTPYASWNPEGPVLDIETIVSQAKATHVVLTGGEPMLFEPIVFLAGRLKAEGHIVTIETAGTVFRDLPCDLMSISPKLANSTPDSEPWRERHERTRIDVNVLRELTRRYQCQLKFVIVDPVRDLPEIEALLTRLPEVDPFRVMLMAEGRTACDLHTKERGLMEVCLRKGWRLSPRYQIDLFGDTRGT